MQRSRRAVLLISTVIAWAACAVPANAIGWLPGPTFADGAIAGTGGVATSAAGVSTVVWVQRDGEPKSVYAQRVDPDGGRGPRQRLGIGSEAVVEGTATGAVVTWAQPTAVAGEYDLQVAWIGADGTVTATRTAVAAMRPIVTGTGIFYSPVIAVKPDGDAIIAWGGRDDETGDPLLNTRTIAADGTLGEIIDLGPVFGYTDAICDVAGAPDGRAWVTWLTEPTEPGGDWPARVARLDPAGKLDGDVTVVSEPGYALHPQLAAGAGGAVATWFEGVGAGGRLQAARLPSSGDVVGERVTVDPTYEPLTVSQSAAAFTPDGIATIAYSDVSLSDGTGRVAIRRMSADGALGPEVALATTAGQLDMGPALAAGAGGSLTAVWTRAPGPSGRLVSRAIAPDGTLAPQEVELPSLGPGVGAGPGEVMLAGSDSGNGIVGALVLAPGGATETYATALLDGAAPVVSATVPASVRRGVDATFFVTATDLAGIASAAWEFGDGSGATGATVSHAYASAGSFPVTIRVTDGFGNVATVSRTIAVTDPGAVVPPSGDEPTPPGGGPALPGGGPALPGGGPALPGGGPAPPAAVPARVVRAAARLKLTKVVRTSGGVTVAGTLDRRASGRVTLSWAQRVGRRTVRRTATAKIVKGRFAATVKLTGTLARARTAGRLTVSYGGDADTLEASATKSVKAPKRRR